MVPAWVSKLKDLKAVSKSKLKHSKAPHLPGLHASLLVSSDADGSMYFAEPFSLKECNSRSYSACLSVSPDAEGLVYFAEPISLKGGSSRSYSVHIGLRSSSCSTETDSIFSSIDVDAAPRMQPCLLSCAGGKAADSNPGRYGSKDFLNSTETPLHSAGCGELEHKFFGLSSCGIIAGSHLFEDKGRMDGCVQDDMYGLLRNETESSVFLTPNTMDSSFGSDSSSMDSSSMAHIRGCVGEGRQAGLVLVQDGDDSSGLESHGSGRETLIYPEEANSCKIWQRNRLVEEVHGDDATSYSMDMEVMPRLSYDKGALSRTKEFIASTAEDLMAISNFQKQRNILDQSPGFCGTRRTSWEERCARIAVENPGLMQSSRWQESACSSQSTADQDRDPPSCNRDGLPVSAEQDDTDNTPVSAQQDDTDGLSMSARQDQGNAGHHESTYKAYVQRGRRHRRSSFSAALPKDLQGVVGDSVALVKMSHDPYEDFRHSMYEMIMDKDLEESMDVEELLYCYLSLNSPEHHELIKEVFSDVWSAILMSVR